MYSKNKKELGGDLGATLGGATDVILPGLGQILGPLLEQVGSATQQKIQGRKDFNAEMGELGLNTNPFNYGDGGTMTGNADLSYYKGKKHINGGILTGKQGIPSTDAVNEVEGEETRFELDGKVYIFSDKLKIQ